MTISGAYKNQAAGFISSGAEDVDRAIGGGIPYHSLMLIEGQSASGKSTLSQQFLWGALTSGENAVLYTTEQTVQSFLRQMDSLGEDVRDYFLLGLLEIFPISVPPNSIDPALLFQELSKNITSHQHCRLVVVDSLTTFVSQAGGDQIQEFFSGCKSLCDRGMVMICTVHADAFDKSVLTRVRSICDSHLRLQVEKSGSQLRKTMEVAKIRGADAVTGTISGFEVEPDLGIRIIPISTAKA